MSGKRQTSLSPLPGAGVCTPHPITTLRGVIHQPPTNLTGFHSPLLSPPFFSTLLFSLPCFPIFFLPSLSLSWVKVLVQMRVGADVEGDPEQSLSEGGAGSPSAMQPQTPMDTDKQAIYR